MSGHPVGGLPGGGRLVDLITDVTGDPGAIRAIGARWTTAGSTAESAGSALRSATSGVDGAWQGAAADSFVGYMDGFVALCTGVKGRLDGGAGLLEQAASLLESTKSTVVNRCDALVSEANALRANAPADAPPEDVEAQVTALVDQVYGELRPLVDDAGTRLGSIAGQLSVPPGDGFAQYPSAGTAPFVPQAGRPIEWAPEAPASTGPTGTDPASGPGSSTSSGPGSSTSSGPGSSAAAGPGGSPGLGPSGAPPPGGGPAPQGQVAEWIRQAIEILRAHGYPVDKMNPNDIWMIIQHESGGDPTAINNWDSNAAKGTPSKGLMQTIDPTFNAHALPGHGDIYNPVDNIIAGVRYAIDRYGSVSDVPGVVGVKTGTGYRGY